MEPRKIVYSVHMFRWGSAENHSYVLGVYSILRNAVNAARQEEEDRGGKYHARISKHLVDTDRSKIVKSEKELLPSLEN